MFFTSVNSFRVLQNNKPNVIDPVNELNISNDKLQMLLNNLINFYYDLFLIYHIYYLSCL